MENVDELKRKLYEIESGHRECANALCHHIENAVLANETDNDFLEKEYIRHSSKAETLEFCREMITHYFKNQEYEIIKMANTKTFDADALAEQLNKPFSKLT